MKEEDKLVTDNEDGEKDEKDEKDEVWRTRIC
jgi:hypothetical protein